MEGVFFPVLYAILVQIKIKKSVITTWQVIPQIIATGMFDKVRQLAFEIHYNNSNTLEEWRANTKIIRSIEEYGFVRFSSKVNLYSHDANSPMSDYLCYELAWFNPFLKRKL